MFETGRRVLSRAKVLSPVDTGNLRAKHRMTMRARRTFVEARIEARTRYARPLHQGTKSHTILPRKKKALKFVYKGRTVIVRRVYHPGTKPRPWLYEALDEVGTRHGYKVARPLG